MGNSYITALIESLEKKIEVLEKIHVIDEEQLSLLKNHPIDFDGLDKNDEEKTVLIYKINKLDEGFEGLYRNVKELLKNNKAEYATEIRTMQSLITKITDLSTKIQAEEARNKLAVEQAFKTERNSIKTQRSGIKAIQSYSQTMKGAPQGYSLYDENR